MVTYSSHNNTQIEKTKKGTYISPFLTVVQKQFQKENTTFTQGEGDHL